MKVSGLRIEDQKETSQRFKSMFLLEWATATPIFMLTLEGQVFGTTFFRAVKVCLVFISALSR